MEPNNEYGCVNNETMFNVEAELLDREEDNDSNKIGFSDIGGIKNILPKIKEVIILPFTHPHLFKTLGIKPLRGILMSGPPGTGKTSIAKAIANECEAYFIHINGPELISGQVGKSEENIRKLFKEAQDN